MIQLRLDGTPEDAREQLERERDRAAACTAAVVHAAGGACALPRLLERAVGILLEAVNDDIRRQIRRAHAIATYEARTRHLRR